YTNIRLTLPELLSYMCCCSLHGSLFFYNCSCHHRHLHSFPTRRSSDLVMPVKAMPVPVFVNLMATLGTTAPEGSVTVPSTDAWLPTCAKTTVEKRDVSSHRKI